MKKLSLLLFLPMKDIVIPEDMEREVKSIVLVSLGAFLFFFYVFSAGMGELYTSFTEDKGMVAEKQVFGVATTADEGRLVDLKLNNSKIGEGVIELDVPTRTNFAGAELYFSIDGDLDVMDVICEPGFLCMEEVSDSSLSVTILRLPEYADVPLIGSNQIATIIYDRATSGELTFNGVATERSSLVEVGSDLNLLDQEVGYLFVGDYNAE